MAPIALCIIHVAAPALALRGDGTVVAADSQGRPAFQVAAACHGVRWSYGGEMGNTRDSGFADGTRTIVGMLVVPETGGHGFRCEVTGRSSPQGLVVAYRFVPDGAFALNSLHVSAQLPVGSFAGGALKLDGTRDVPLPHRYQDATLYAGPMQVAEIAWSDGPTYVVRATDPADIILHDTRAWNGDTFELRLNLLRGGEGVTVAEGATYEVELTFASVPAARVMLAEEEQTSVNDTSRWYPYTMPWDDFPVDVSFLNEKPAGQHGWIVARGDRFVFEDGTPAVFWGTCVSAGANFPSHEQAERIARRMAKAGVNMIRTHHADAGWSQPNLFGNDPNTTRRLDPQALDLFDYFLACCKREGIYVFLDQLVHRKFLPGDGVENAEQLPFAAKPYVYFDPTLIALQKEFSEQLWTHVNPYTGLRYCDDPAIAMMEITNENDLFSEAVTVEPYRTRLQERWRAWCAEQGVDPQSADPCVGYPQTADAARFLYEIQCAYYTEMRDFLRGIGVRVPISGTNWSRHPAHLASQLVLDFTDSHTYYDHPDQRGRFSNRCQVTRGQLSGDFTNHLHAYRCAGAPFAVSEWNQPWPNEWRAESVPLMAWSQAFQLWDATLIYTYRHTPDPTTDRLSGAFETYNDPCLFGLFPAASLLVRRGDVALPRETVGIAIGADRMFEPSGVNLYGMPAIVTGKDVHGIRTVLGDRPAEGCDRIVRPEDSLSDSSAVVESDTGEYRWYVDQGYATLDTPRNKAAWGHIGGRDVELGGVRLRVTSPEFAVLFVTALDPVPLAEARRILVTAVARAENTGTVYDLTRNALVDTGRGPILLEPVEALVSVPGSPVTAHAITADGGNGGVAPVAYEDGASTVTIGAGLRSPYCMLSR